MPLRVLGLRLPVGGDPDSLLPRALRKAGLGHDDVERAVVTRQSVDRRRGTPVFVFNLDLHLKEEPHGSPRPRLRHGVKWVAPPSLDEGPRGETPLEHRPVVIGSGPAGLFAALWLARMGYRPRILERGEAMNLRVRRIRDINRKGILHPESNYLFGEGGAGTFSDGKLTSRSKDPRAAWVLEEFRRLSGEESVSYHYRPHLGSERIRTVVGRIRQELVGLGCPIEYGSRARGLDIRGGRVVAVQTDQGDIPADAVVLAPGHSARDLVRTLAAQGVPVERKPFQLGFRVEHPQDQVDAAVWGKLAGHEALGPADYRLAVRVDAASVFSFCMCPGGEIMPAVNDIDHMNTNGMSHTGRSSGFANSGIVTTLEPESFEGSGPLAGIAMQERYEGLAAASVGRTLAVPGQRLMDYLEGRPSADLPPSSCQTGVRAVDVSGLVPPDVNARVRAAIDGLERQLPGFVGERALLVGPEARSSSPVRFPRDPDTLECVGVTGVMPVGEGAGQAGGIVSAAVDGLRAAQAVVARHAPSSHHD